MARIVWTDKEREVVRDEALRIFNSPDFPTHKTFIHALNQAQDILPLGRQRSALYPSSVYWASPEVPISANRDDLKDRARELIQIIFTQPKMASGKLMTFAEAEALKKNNSGTGVLVIEQKAAEQLNAVQAAASSVQADKTSVEASAAPVYMLPGVGVKSSPTASTNPSTPKTMQITLPEELSNMLEIAGLIKSLPGELVHAFDYSESSLNMLRVIEAIEKQTEVLNTISGQLAVIAAKPADPIKFASATPTANQAQIPVGEASKENEAVAKRPEPEQQSNKNEPPEQRPVIVLLNLDSTYVSNAQRLYGNVFEFKMLDIKKCGVQQICNNADHYYRVYGNQTFVSAAHSATLHKVFGDRYIRFAGGKSALNQSLADVALKYSIK